jgi:SPP1 family predicted phage head-tail adaptor
MSLNDRIGLQKKIQGKGPTGQPTQVWEQFAKPWADAKSISGRQFTSASAEQSEVTMTFKVRKRGDVIAGMRVTHNGQTFEVVAPLQDVPRNFTTLMCKSVKT